MKSSRIMIVISMLCISVVCAVLYVHRFVVAPSSASNGGTPPVESKADEPPKVDTPVLPTVEYSVLPRQPKLIDGVAVGVSGGAKYETLMESYALGGYVYALVHTYSNGQDYRAAENGSLAVARYDSNGVLTDTVTLDGSAGCEYLCSSLYDNGILIVAKEQEAMRLFGISFSLSQSTATVPYNVVEARCVYTPGGAVIAAIGERLHVFCADNNLQVGWSYSTPALGYRLLELYDYNGIYSIFCAGTTAGTVFRCSSSGLLGQTAIERPDAVVPYASGYVVGRAGTNAELYSYSYDLAYIGCTELGSGSALWLGSYNGGAVAFVKEEQKVAGYLLCNHLDIQCTFALPMGELSQAPEWQNGYFLTGLTQNEQWQPIVYTPRTNIVQSYAAMTGAEHTKLWPTASGIGVLCDSVFNYGLFADNHGGRDVFWMAVAAS